LFDEAGIHDVAVYALNTINADEVRLSFEIAAETRK
jgi:hypothetical protein